MVVIAIYLGSCIDLIITITSASEGKMCKLLSGTLFFTHHQYNIHLSKQRGAKKIQLRPQHPEESGNGNRQPLGHLVGRKVL